jgi:hypothetical protein
MTTRSRSAAVPNFVRTTKPYCGLPSVVVWQQFSSEVTKGIEYVTECDAPNREVTISS